MEFRFGAVEGFLWLVFVSVAGMVEPKAVVVVVSPELTLTLILVSKVSISCPARLLKIFKENEKKTCTRGPPLTTKC